MPNGHGWRGRAMHKSSLSLNDYGVSPLESDMQGNLPVSFGKGATEKGWKAPRRCPPSFGGGRLETCCPMKPPEIFPGRSREETATRWPPTRHLGEAFL